MSELTKRLLHFFDYLRDREQIRTNAELASILGVSTSMLTEISKGRTNAGIGLVQATLSKFCQLNVEWVLTGKGDMIKSEIPQVITVDHTGHENISMVPLKAKAGYLTGYADPEYLGRLPTHSLPLLPRGTYRAFEVDGHSMHPTLRHGDIVVGSWCESIEHITDGQVYVILTPDAGILVKRVERQPGRLIAHSDAFATDPNYPDLHLDYADIQELWHVERYISADLSVKNTDQRLDQIARTVSRIEKKLG